MAKFGSTEGLLKQCNSELSGFGEKLKELKRYVEEIQSTILESDE